MTGPRRPASAPGDVGPVQRVEPQLDEVGDPGGLVALAAQVAAGSAAATVTHRRGMQP